MRVDRHVGELRFVGSQGELPCQQALPAGGIDDRAHPDGAARGACNWLRYGLDRDAAGIEIAAGHPVAFADLDSQRARTLEQDAVELLAADLVGLRLGNLARGGEVHPAAALAVEGQQARPPFFRKIGRRHLLGHSESREGLVRSRQQRLADVEARKALLLEEHDTVPFLRQGDRRGGSGGSAASDGEVEIESAGRNAHR